MQENKLFANIDSLQFQTTSHAIGKKIVFFSKEELQTEITQIAIATLQKDEIVPFHLHETMEEVFYILSGNGIFYIEDENVNAIENSCIRIPVGFLHSIKANTEMKLFYFGVALNKK
jgi:mannose-6-phosphate isomerase-like protein (cupin superfamily)